MVKIDRHELVGDARMAQFFSAADVADTLEFDLEVPEDERLLAATALIVSTYILKVVDPASPTLQEAVAEELQVFGVDPESVQTFAEEHASPRGVGQLFRNIHAAQPGFPGFMNYPRSWSFDPQQFLQGYLRNRKRPSDYDMAQE